MSSYMFTIRRVVNSRLFIARQFSNWKVNDVRRTFVDYFVEHRAHQFIKSSPVVPYNDDSLLFTNAGMNQFKSIFLGTVDPHSPLNDVRRAVNSQKCIRAGGKHNDLEDVGKDTYHHTFFEMLGTWSFGCYFKKEAIDWAYDLLVNKYHLDKERMYVTYFAGDDAMGVPCDTEARDYWLNYLPASRVLPFGAKENFWEMGDIGPCGPCSEIHYDRIGNRNAAVLVNCDDPTVLEIWNLVFMQYHREKDEESGKVYLKKLPAAHVDTGMGLERLTSILQDKNSNYDTDVFYPIFDELARLIGPDCIPYMGKTGTDDAGCRDMAYRVVADHMRALCVAIADGVVPSSEKRGYVIRRILRRALRYCMVLDAPPGTLSSLVPVVVRVLGSAYPELHDKEALICSTIAEEETSFASVLPRGMKYLEERMGEQTARDQPALISGRDVFYLYDTMGFPVDLTRLIAAEKGFEVDMAGYENEMNLQREKSKISARGDRSSDGQPLQLSVHLLADLKSNDVLPTDDSYKYNYTQTNVDVFANNLNCNVRAILSDSNELIERIDAGILNSNISSKRCGIILDKTPFYAESGGQVCDTGYIKVAAESGEFILLPVTDVQSFGSYVLHTCCLPDSVKVRSWCLTVGSSVIAVVDNERKKRIVPNHTATHILNHVLRKVVAPSVEQRGSLVSEDKLRFDFSSSHALTNAQLAAVEYQMNEFIQQGLEVDTKLVPKGVAVQINGLRTVAGESYPDPVRVVSVGASVDAVIDDPASPKWMDCSIEFCGGNHVSSSSQLEDFVLTEESAVSKGVRRIAALTGDSAKCARLRAVELLDRMRSVQASDLPQTVLELDNLRNKVVQLSSDMESSVISVLVKNDIRAALEGMQKQLQKARKAAQLKDTEKVIGEIGIQAGKCAGSKYGVFVLSGEEFSDSSVVKLVHTEIAKNCPGVPYVLVIRARSRILCTASVPQQSNSSRLHAVEWIKHIIGPFGGKGGGKADAAQGSVKGVDNTDDIAKLAREFATSQLL